MRQVSLEGQRGGANGDNCVREERRMSELRVCVKVARSEVRRCEGWF